MFELQTNSLLYTTLATDLFKGHLKILKWPNSGNRLVIFRQDMELSAHDGILMALWYFANNKDKENEANFVIIFEEAPKIQLWW